MIPVIEVWLYVFMYIVKLTCVLKKMDGWGIEWERNEYYTIHCETLILVYFNP